MIDIDIGKIENLYYRPTILMRYSKALYKTMLRETKNDERKFSRWKKREWNSQLLEDYQNITMVNKVQVPRNVNNDGVRGGSGAGMRVFNPHVPVSETDKLRHEIGVQFRPSLCGFYGYKHMFTVLFLIWGPSSPDRIKHFYQRYGI